MFTEFIILIILIMINGFFAASEMALVTVNDTKIKIMADDGNEKAQMVEKLLKQPNNFLSTIQIGITLAGFLSSAFASEAFAGQLVLFIHRIGIQIPENILKPISMIVITIILSYFSLVFGELVPKRIAMQRAEQFALAVVKPLNGLSKITLPLVKFLSISTNFFVKMFGFNPEAKEDEVTEEEIRMMVDVGEEKGTIDEYEKEFINNVFDFDDKVVSEIMTHRTRISAVPIDASLNDILDTISKDKFTRIPVYEDTIDNIVGILHVKDLLQFITKNELEAFDIKKIIRDAYFVPESKKLNDLFNELQINSIHMVVVIDEYGGTAGIITIEDLLEEIVGNIFDEYDDIEVTFEKVDDATYIFDGSAELELVNELMDIDLPIDDYDTLSGYVIGLLGKIPGKDEKPVVETDHLVFKVEQVEEKRISRIKVCKV